MKWFVSFLAGLSVLSFSACSTPLSIADRTRLKRVGVISLLGDEVRGRYFGETIFHSQYYETAVPEFGVDQFLENLSVKRLRERTGMDAFALPSERRTLSASARFTGLNAVLSDPDAICAYKLPELVPAIAQRHRLDAVLIWWPQSADRGPMRLQGVALTGNSMAGDKIMPQILFSAALYDGQTGKRLAGLNLSNSALRYAHLAKFPQVPQVIWRKTFGDYTPAERTALRGTIHERLEANANEVLQSLGVSSP